LKLIEPSLIHKNQIEKEKEFRKYVVIADFLFIIDNLETINDDEFINYITDDLELLSAQSNKNSNKLKILTTSRVKILDNDIIRNIGLELNIEGLKEVEALEMLMDSAAESETRKGIKYILNASRHVNLQLVKKVGCVPIGISFIVEQMRLGKSAGQILYELEGFPSLDKNSFNEVERSKKISKIIQFAYKNMGTGSV
jgi:hypothetical protein